LANAAAAGSDEPTSPVSSLRNAASSAVKYGGAVRLLAVEVYPNDEDDEGWRGE